MCAVCAFVLLFATDGDELRAKIARESQTIRTRTKHWNSLEKRINPITPIVHNRWQADWWWGGHPHLCHMGQITSAQWPHCYDSKRRAGTGGGCAEFGACFGLIRAHLSGMFDTKQTIQIDTIDQLMNIQIDRTKHHLLEVQCQSIPLCELLSLIRCLPFCGDLLIEAKQTPLKCNRFSTCMHYDQNILTCTTCVVVRRQTSKSGYI